MIEGLKATGGGDCPELAMKGILNALELVDEGSALFVFTDAAAKDSDLKTNVTIAATEKSTTISFFGKQDCGSLKDHAVYGEIASALEGHVVCSISREESLEEMVKILTTSTGNPTGRCSIWL
jgi:hypothetical protein